MTARTEVNDGEVARLQVHQDVLVLDVPDDLHEEDNVNEHEYEEFLLMMKDGNKDWTLACAPHFCPSSWSQHAEPAMGHNLDAIWKMIEISKFTFLWGLQSPRICSKYQIENLAKEFV